jgi:hypothetical protein
MKESIKPEVDSQSFHTTYFNTMHLSTRDSCKARQAVSVWVEGLLLFMMELILQSQDSLLQLNLSLDRGNELTHKGIHSVAEGLGYVPQLTHLDIRSAASSLR